MSLLTSTPTKGFGKALVPATLGGALWEWLGLPLGWLMGAAIVAGGFAMMDIAIAVPKPLYSLSLVTLGASVGLAITPDVALEMARWAPVMVAAGVIGVAAAALIAPTLARLGRMNLSTAFFSLLPGGVIEMANIGAPYGADRTIVSALHAMRVALVVGILPIALFLFVDIEVLAGPVTDVSSMAWLSLGLTLLVGGVGGWIGSKIGLPAAWLLGALIAVGVFASTGWLSGQMPQALLAAVQIIVGIFLGARFQRERLSAIPRALGAGLPALLLIMAFMAIAATLASLFMPFPLATLILGFSIGGMAEMVLTAKALGQGVALVAAFQAVRGIFVNACAGLVWRQVLLPLSSSNSTKE